MSRSTTWIETGAQRRGASANCSALLGPEKAGARASTPLHGH